ncbi:MAG: hypothetical protein ACO3B3_07915 [Cyanobium sp.]|jgi:hypothetical protein
MTPTSPALPATEPQRRPRGRRIIPLALLVLAFLDLRTDLQLLADHVTLTAVAEAIRNHPLAVMVLLITPSLWRRYRG